MFRDFANRLLGPTLRKNPLTKDIKIIAHDDQRDILAKAADEVRVRTSLDHMFRVPFQICNVTDGSEDFVDGFGIHWYCTNCPHELLTEVHSAHSEKFLLATEVWLGGVRTQILLPTSKSDVESRNRTSDMTPTSDSKSECYVLWLSVLIPLIRSELSTIG